MPTEPHPIPVDHERPAGRAIHATAVAIAGSGLLIVGPSRSGKSRLACALIEGSTPRCPIRLVGDDRILIRDGPGGPVARPHPRIAGFIERRGLGIVATPHVAEATIRAIVALGPTTLARDLGQNFPCFSFVSLRIGGPDRATDQAAELLRWFRGATTTPSRKPPPSQGQGRAKD